MMKKIILLLSAFVVSIMAGDSFVKRGFLTTESCAKAGAFTECYMENYTCGSDGCYLNTDVGVDKKIPLVLFSHDDGIIYKLDISAISRAKLDEGISKNAVTIIGELDASTHTIIVHEFQAPPPQKKYFFKDCL